LASIDMKYAIPNARGDFGERGLRGAFEELKEEGKIEVRKEKIGFDYFSRAHPIQ